LLYNARGVVKPSRAPSLYKTFPHHWYVNNNYSAVVNWYHCSEVNGTVLIQKKHVNIYIHIYKDHLFFISLTFV